MRMSGAEFGDFADDSIVGLAKEYAGRNYEDVRQELIDRIFRGLADQSSATPSVCVTTSRPRAIR